MYSGILEMLRGESATFQGKCYLDKMVSSDPLL